MRSSLLTLLTAITLIACSPPSPAPTTLTPTSDPVTRLVLNQADPILRAGVTALRDMGFTVNDPEPGAIRVFSQPLIVQSRWRGEPVARRILCGIGTAGESDPIRLTQLANTIPVEISLGYEVEPRAETTATTVLFVAAGRRTETVVPGTPTMACTLTVPFVNELFTELESRLRASAGGSQ